MKKKTLISTLCPFKLSGKEKLIVAWFALSIALLCISDDSPIWVILLVLANFATSAYCLRYVHIKDEEDV